MNMKRMLLGSLVTAILWATLGGYEAVFLMLFFLMSDIPDKGWRDRNRIEARLGPIVDAKSAMEVQWMEYWRVRLFTIATVVPMLVLMHFLMPYFRT
jgi:hypothetical protein